MLRNETVYICSPLRSPIGSFMGKLSDKSAIELGTLVVLAVIKKSGIEERIIDEVFFGNVLSANLGQNPARQIALKAGLPSFIPCTTVNKVCASGLKAVLLAAQSILLGQNRVVLAGGTESMSNAPFYSDSTRRGRRFGDCKLVDGLLKDGLTCPFNDISMGLCAEKCAEKMSVSRGAQDAFSEQSYRLSLEANEKGQTREEIVPVVLSLRGGREEMTSDEELKNFDPEKMALLRPAFKEHGTLTAANSSKISDGAAAMLLASESAVKEFSLQPAAKIIGFADAARDPVEFALAPLDAIQKALTRASLSVTDIDYWEINEAFAVVPISVMKILSLDRAKVNAHGGSVALGHPLGCSGARILTTLTNVLKKRNVRYGVAAICNGGGGASAIVIESC